MNDPIPDGRYDVFVVDARADHAAPNVMHLEVTIVGGEHRGEVMSLTATGLAGADVELIGLPGVMTIADGTPNVVLEP